MRIRPIGDRVVLKQFQAEEKTKSGIILTNSMKEKPSIFEVIEISDGKMSDGTEVKLQLKIGDKVICNKFVGLPIKLDDVEYTIIRESDILGLIED